MARPGGNVTGVFLDFPNSSGKWFELRVECVPKLSRIALIWDPATGRVQVDALTAFAARLGLQIEVLESRARTDYPGVFAGASHRRGCPAILLSCTFALNNLKARTERLLRHTL